MAGNTDDPTWILLIFICAILLIGWLIWFFFEPQLLEFMRYLRLAEIVPLMPFDQKARACFHWLWIVPLEKTVPADSTVLAAANCFGVNTLRPLPAAEAMQYYTLTATSVGAVSRHIMDYWRWIVLGVAVYVIYKALFVFKKDAFKTRYNLESFIKVQAKIWPVIQPIVDFNPSKHSARIPGSLIPEKLPLFAEALSPEEWVSAHQIGVEGGVPNKDRTRQAFLAQLGPRWAGYKGLPPYVLGLLAAFALKGVQKREESDEFLGKLSTCWTATGGFRPTAEIMAEIQKILKDPEIGGKALEIAAKHAYRTTALLGVLRWARFMGGVLASAQFLWLRGTDRTLWYALNNLGRRSFHMEGAGAMAHYMAEEAAGKALPIPRLETAIVALNQYFAANQPELPPFAGAGKDVRAS